MQGNNRKEATLGNTAKTNECRCSLTIQLIELRVYFQGRCVFHEDVSLTHICDILSDMDVLYYSTRVHAQRVKSGL